MKRLSIILLFLLISFSLVSGIEQATAADPSPENQTTIFLPIVMKPPLPYTVSGTVRDDTAAPLPDVAVIDANGNIAITDSEGNYSLPVPAGTNTILALKPGYTFTPEEKNLAISASLVGENFTAALGCGDVMVNGGLSYSGGGWNFPSADAWNFSTAGTDPSVFHSADRSGRTGVLAAWSPPAGFGGSDSYAVSQVYNLPSDADSVTLGMWIYQLSTAADNDHQYIRLLNGNTNGFIADLLWTRANTGSWTYVEYSLNAYLGQSIKIRVGVVSDSNTAGATAMYFDDVSLVVCKSASPVSSCANLLVNSGFEDITGWLYQPPQTIPPSYTNAHAAYGVWSMRTGIPLGNPVENSTSEVYQDVTIPLTATSPTLSMYVYTTSSEPSSAPANLSEQPTLGSPWGMLAPTNDIQYAYILDGSGNTLKKLFWWSADNHPTWTYLEFDLSEYVGDSIRILFGTFNDAGAGVSAMYLDEVRLETCPSPTPIPGPGCYEALNNRSFENSSYWTIPATIYPAGYTTHQAYSGNRSMRAGIIDPAHNRYSFSDFYQKVKIPASADSASLTFWVWTKSLETSARSSAPANFPLLSTGLNISQLQFDPASADLQYLLALDQYGNILGNSWVWSKLWDYRAWKKVSLDLSDFTGDTLRLQFGVYNNGDYTDHVTYMYVDDVSLIICDP